MCVCETGEWGHIKRLLPSRNILCIVHFCYNNVNRITSIAVLLLSVSNGIMLICEFAVQHRPGKKMSETLMLKKR